MGDIAVVMIDKLRDARINMTYAGLHWYFLTTQSWALIREKIIF
jgi:hypothetical protein